jgi:2-dehydro-3-deoxygluconokinase
MLELHHVDDVTLRLGYAGDTYNTAVYLRRFADELGVDVDVGYFTGVGADEYSTAMRTAWADEGIIDAAMLFTDRLPGLYTVRVDAHGERRFTYWRNGSAAESLFSGIEWLARLDADVVYLSGITLQLTPPPVREALVSRLDELRASGTRIALDTNYRPTGWPSVQAAAEAIDTVASRGDIVLASHSDETALHGAMSPHDAAQRIAALGPSEVIVKSGADGAWVSTGRAMTRVPAVPPRRVVDTTAAGDSFAGGYLAARLAGHPPPGAAALAARVASVVIAYPGAIAPRGVALAAPTAADRHSRARRQAPVPVSPVHPQKGTTR